VIKTKSDKKNKKTKKEDKVEDAEMEDINDDGLNAFKDADPNSKEWKNRQRTLVLCSRGVNSRYRHLMNDIIDLLPHSKKEVKVERTAIKSIIDDICF